MGQAGAVREPVALFRDGAVSRSLEDRRCQPDSLVELPGIDSVLTGLALANEGYRPVPLYNVNVGPNAVVDVDAIAGALRLGAEAMAEMRIAPDAPPAFLLDANRMRPTRMIGPGKFDNRWIVMPQDFPSATMLMSRGVKDVLVIASGDNPARGDLAHVLLRWRRAGLPILALDPKSSERPREMRIEPPSLFRRAWYRLIALAGLRRSNVGGFGAQIPEEYDDEAYEEEDENKRRSEMR